MIKRWAVLGLSGTASALLFVLACSTPHSQRDPASEPYQPSLHKNAIWALDPKIHGEDLPPKGRSVFDQLVTVEESGRYVPQIPFPFTSLLKKISDQLVETNDELVGFNSGILGVLLPRGRSLQRNTEWHAPRVVIAVTGEPKQQGSSLGLFLKNRLYIGYSELTSTLEVISYNEELARYEYQIVKDYDANGRPKVAYAQRGLCLECHQNQAPLFSEADWKETNAFPEVQNKLLQEMYNPLNSVPTKIADRLVKKQIRKADGSSYEQVFYQGVPLRVPDAMPYSIDQTTDEANLYGPYQTVWQNLCGQGDDRRECQTQALELVLRYHLTRQLNTSDHLYQSLSSQAQRVWKQLWPNGLLIGNPNIPNRNPFRDIRTAGDDAKVAELVNRINSAQDRNNLKESAIPHQFEPLNTRWPLEVWSMTEDNRGDFNSVLMGLSQFLTATDQKIIDSRLFQLGSAPEIPRKKFRSGCKTISMDSSSPSHATNLGLSTVKFTCNLPLESPLAHLVLGGQVQVRGQQVVQGNVVLGLGPSECSLGNLGNDPVCKPSVTGKLLKDGDQMRLRLSPLEPTSHAHLRLADGNAVEYVEIAWTIGQEKSAEATAQVLGDYAFLSQAIMRLSFTEPKIDPLAAGPFRRNLVMVALMSELGVPLKTWDCCGNAVAGVVDGVIAQTTVEQILAQVPQLGPFYNNCVKCHANSFGHPPNWLAGQQASRIVSQIDECKERLYYRLSMWDTSLKKATSVGEMRPAGTVRDAALWNSDREKLLDFLAGRMGFTRSQANQKVLSQDYFSFAACRTATESSP